MLAVGVLAEITWIPSTGGGLRDGFSAEEIFSGIAIPFVERLARIGALDGKDFGGVTA